MKSQVTNKVRLSRLERLRDVVQKHREAKGKPVKLNGEKRQWFMAQFDCGYAACAHGSYCLTPYGKKYFQQIWIGSRPYPLLRQGSLGVAYSDAAIHFGITEEETEWLFEPSKYGMHPIPPYAVIRRINSLIKKYGD